MVVLVTPASRAPCAVDKKPIFAIEVSIIITHINDTFYFSVCQLFFFKKSKFFLKITLTFVK
jgi:hypothetical protein